MRKSRNRHEEPPHHPITGEVITRYLDILGREVLDPTPMEPPIGYKRTPTLAEQIKQMVQSQLLARVAEEAGHESFAESEDFDVGDDFDPNSPYEEDFDPPPPPPTADTKKAADAAPTASPEAPAPVVEPEADRKSPAKGSSTGS